MGLITTSLGMSTGDTTVILASGKNEGRRVSIKVDKRNKGVLRVPKEELENQYVRDSITFNSINKTVQMLMSIDYSIRAEKLSTIKFYEDFFKNIGNVGERLTMTELLECIYRDLVVFGDAYVEIIFDDKFKPVDLTRIDSKRMDVARDTQGYALTDKYGKPVGYVMSIPYGMTATGDPVPQEYQGKIDLNQKIFMMADRIVHFKLYQIQDGFSAIGLIEPAYLSTQRKLAITEAQTNSIYARGTYPMIANVGDLNHEPTDDDIEKTLNILREMKHDRYFAFPYWTKVTPLEAKQSDIVDQTLSFLREDQAASLGMPLAFAVGSGEATNRACYSEDTKVLTKEGWKDYKAVNNSEIAIYDKDKDEIRFEKHGGLYEYDYDGEMINFSGKSEDILVTPDHRMLFRKNSPSRDDLKNNKEWIVDKAENIDTYYFSFKKNAKWSLEESNNEDIIIPKIHEEGQGKHNELYSEDIKINRELFNEFLGYYLSEGGLSSTGKSYTITFAQKEPKSDKFRECFNKLPFHFTEYFDNNDKIWRWSISDKRLWTFMKSFGEYCNIKNINNFKEQDENNSSILFNAMMLGDGTWEREGEKGCYYTTSDKLAEDFVYLSMKLGYSANISIGYIESEKRFKMNRVNLIKDRTEITHSKNCISKTSYEGKVYCFNTSTGFFLTMRNGKVAIQGNTLNNQQTIMELTLNDVMKRTLSTWNKYIMKPIADAYRQNEAAQLIGGTIGSEEKNEKATRLQGYVKVGSLPPESITKYIMESEGLADKKNDRVITI